MSTPTLSEPHSDEDDGEQYLRAFVGPRADYYLQKWSPLLLGGGRGAGFNWAAFTLFGAWLPFRKMYFFSLIFYGAIIVETIVEDLLFIGFFGMAGSPPILNSVVAIGAGIICGAYGNRWYLSHARRAISDVRARGLEKDAALVALSKRGGTSLAASLGLISLFVIVATVVLGSFFYEG